MNVQLFYHVALLGPWRAVVADQMTLFRRVGLEPKIGIVGRGCGVAYRKRIGDVVVRELNVKEYEIPTLQRLWEWCREHPDDAVIYAHTKGVSRPGALRTHWRHLLEKWVIEPWRQNLPLLDQYDIIGVDLRTAPQSYRGERFSGNFWMARASWINRLPEPSTYQKSRPRYYKNKSGPWERMCAEDWPLTVPNGKALSLCCRGVKLHRGKAAQRLLAMPYQCPEPGLAPSWCECLPAKTETTGASTEGTKMTPHIIQWLAKQASKIKGRVLEVGSYNVNGSPRCVIQAQEYIGVDMAPGPGVDIVCNAHDLIERFGRESFDVVISCEMIEHDSDPAKSVEAMRAVLKPGGLLVITSPANGFPEHRFPKDYFRFMPDYYRDVLFKGMESVELCTVGGKEKCTCVIGTKGA